MILKYFTCILINILNFGYFSEEAKGKDNASLTQIKKQISLGGGGRGGSLPFAKILHLLKIEVFFHFEKVEVVVHFFKN